jgi:SMI1 / KNR4 family (SUKH-1)
MSGIKKWQDLLDGLTVEGYSFAVTDEQLSSFENLLGFRLPKEYRDFYKVFGLGIFGGDDPLVYFDSDVLPIPEMWPERIASERDIRRSQFLAPWLKTSTNCDYASLEENSYIFAYAEFNGLFLWDLRTWNPEQESYLIYFFIPENDLIQEIGYSFYDFVIRYFIEKKFREDIVTWGRYEDIPTPDSQESVQCDEELDMPAPPNKFAAPNHFFRPDETPDEFRDAYWSGKS